MHVGAEPRLFLLRRAWDEEKKRLKTVITVDEVRRLKSFFQLSATDGGRRVAIVDAADDMNTAAANAPATHPSITACPATNASC